MATDAGWEMRMKLAKKGIGKDGYVADSYGEIPVTDEWDTRIKDKIWAEREQEKAGLLIGKPLRRTRKYRI
jgi:hypothetical protein